MAEIFNFYSVYLTICMLMNKHFLKDQTSMKMQLKASLRGGSAFISWLCRLVTDKDQ